MQNVSSPVETVRECVRRDLQVVKELCGKDCSVYLGRILSIYLEFPSKAHEWIAPKFRFTSELEKEISEIAGKVIRFYHIRKSIIPIEELYESDSKEDLEELIRYSEELKGE